MKTFFLAAAIFIPTASYAADIAVKAPPPSVVYNWTGFYIGGFIGGAGADRDASASEPLGPAGFPYNGPNRLNTSYGLGSSFIGGGTVGYNWQRPGSNFVLGIEGEAGYIHLNGSRQDVNAVLNGIALPDSINSTRVGDAYGVIAGRIGWTGWANRSLFYLKGGVAFVGHSYSFNDPCNTGLCGLNMLFIGRNDTQVTYAVGAGWEYALTNSWSIKAEYLYLGTQRSYTNSGMTTGFTAFPIVATPVLLTNTNSDPGVHTGKIGINYRWGGPIVAKY